MIKINKIDPPTCEVYDPNGVLMGVVNEYELLDLRIQIKNNQTWGYTIVFGDQTIRLDKNGELEEYPIGLLDSMSNLYLMLL